MCAITSSRSKQGEDRVTLSDPFNLSSTFMARGDLDLTGFGKIMPSHARLVSKQKADPTLCSLFQETVSEDDINEEACGYFLSDGLLKRKWTSPKMSCQGDWSSVFQIVVLLLF